MSLYLCKFCKNIGENQQCSNCFLSCTYKIYHDLNCCPICYNSDKIRYFKCGHGMCPDCDKNTDNADNTGNTCCFCKQPKKYINIIDSNYKNTIIPASYMNIMKVIEKNIDYLPYCIITLQWLFVSMTTNINKVPYLFNDRSYMTSLDKIVVELQKDNINIANYEYCDSFEHATIFIDACNSYMKYFPCGKLCKLLQIDSTIPLINIDRTYQLFVRDFSGCTRTIEYNNGEFIATVKTKIMCAIEVDIKYYDNIWLSRSSTCINETIYRLTSQHDCCHINASIRMKGD